MKNKKKKKPGFVQLSPLDEKILAHVCGGEPGGDGGGPIAQTTGLLVGPGPAPGPGPVG